MDLFSIYSRTPVFVQNALCSIQGYKLKKQRYNEYYEEILNFLGSTQKWTGEDITRYKEEQLYKIIKHAYDTCPYYQDKFKANKVTPSDFKSIEDLNKFPILTKDDIRNNWEKMISTSFNKKDLVLSHTSGSTGKPLNFYWTKYSIAYYWALHTRYINRFTQINDLNLVSTVKPVVPINANKPPYWRFVKPLNHYRINMQQITDDKIFDIVDFLNKTPFKYYEGYCSIISNLAEKIKKNNLSIDNPPLNIFVGSEKLYDFHKEIIQEVFKGTKIHEMYSLSEQVVFASHCKNNNYHEDFEIGHIESSNTYNSEIGKIGDILATSFVNYGMPFIRYNTGDTAVFSEEKCSCGSHAQVIKDILGRSEDYIHTPEGAKIHTFSYIVKGVDSVKECQVYQKDVNEIIVRIVKRDNYDQNSEKKIIHNVRTYISKLIDVRFEYLDSISKRSSGKFKAVVSEIDK